MDTFDLKNKILAFLIDLKKIFKKESLKVNIKGKNYNVVRKTWNKSCNN